MDRLEVVFKEVEVAFEVLHAVEAGAILVVSEVHPVAVGALEVHLEEEGMAGWIKIILVF